MTESGLTGSGAETTTETAGAQAREAASQYTQHTMHNAAPESPREWRGRAVHEAVRAFVAARKSTDPMAPVTVVMPGDLAALSMRRFLARDAAGSRGVAGVSVTTPLRLAGRLASAAEPRRPLPRSVLSAAVRAVLRRDPGVFAAVADNARTVQALVRSFETLSGLEALPDAEDILALIGRAQPAQDAVRVYRAARDRLREQWYRPADVFAAAIDRLGRAEPVPGLAEAGAVIAAAPRGRAHGMEELFLEAVAARAPYESVEAADSEAHADEVLHAADPDDEVRTVVRRIVGDLEHGAVGHGIGVFYTTAAPYARLLHAHLDAAEIAWNGPGSDPVSARAAARFLLGLLDLPEEDFARADVCAVLAAVPTVDFAGSPVPAARWDRISREAGVVSGGDWDMRLARFAESLRLRADEADRAAGAGAAAESAEAHAGRGAALRARAGDADALRRFVAELIRRFAEVRAAAAAGGTEGRVGAIEAARALWEDVSAGLRGRSAVPPEERSALSLIDQAWETLIDAAPYGGHGSRTVRLADLREALAEELRSSVPAAGRFGEGVFVGPVAAAHGLVFSRVYVVGLSEDLYPGRTSEDPLLPDALCESLPGVLPDAKERIVQQRRDLYAAFDSGSSTVAGFARGDLRGAGERLPSRWLLPTLTALAVGDAAVQATGWADRSYRSVTAAASFAQNLAGTALPATEQEWRVRAAAVGGLGYDPALSAAVAAHEARADTAFTRFDGNLVGEDGLPDYTDGVAGIAPTRLEAYAECPYAYFVRHILGVEPAEEPGSEPEITPLEVGNLLHGAVDGLISGLAPDERPGYGQPWTQEHQRLLLEHFDRQAEALRAEGGTGHETLWRRTRPALERDLRGYLERDNLWRAEARVGVYASEVGFGTPDTPRVQIPLPDGRAVSVRGSADRVDLGEDGTVYVTDLKTGSIKPYAGIGQDDPTAGGTKLQLPAYAYAARAVLGEADAPVRTRYWFVRHGNQTTDLDLTEEVEQVYAHAVQVIVDAIHGGRFPARPPEKDDFTHVQCEYCNPDGVGYGAVRARWSRKRDAAELAEYVGLTEPEGRK